MKRHRCDTTQNIIMHKNKQKSVNRYILSRKYRLFALMYDLFYILRYLYRSNRNVVNKYRKYCKAIGFKYTLLNAIYCSLVYGCDLEEYYTFKYYSQNSCQRASWISIRYLRVFTHIINSQKFRYVSEDKLETYKTFNKYMKREVLCISNKTEPELLYIWIAQRNKVLMKPRYGIQGIGIELFDSSVSNDERIKQIKLQLKDGAEYLLEEYIEQHPSLEKFNPKSVNTVRVTTLYNGESVIILGAVFRMGNNHFVDNSSRGGLTVPVDIKSGEISSPAIFRDPTNNIDYEHHPLTGEKIMGYKIPYWEEAVRMVTEMALVVEGAITAGWDIAITKNGPSLVEVNHDWSNVIYQLSYKRGRLDTILPYIDKSLLYPIHRKYFAEYFK